MKALSKVADQIPRSGIREIGEMAGKLPDVIRLSVGEPSFGTPPHIVEAAFEAAAAGATKYTSNYGTPELRQAVADRYAAKWNRPVGPENALISTGGVNAIGATTYAIIEPGDEVLVPDPGWPNYISILGLVHGVPVRYPMTPEDGFRPDIDALQRLVTPKTKLLLLCNPSNPTGVVFEAATVQALIEFARRNDLYVIADEIYEELVFDGTHVSAASFDDEGRVVTVSGFSKTYAMTGWRLGWAIANPELIRLAGKLMEPLTSCPSAVSQAAGLAALSGPQDTVSQMRDAYRRRRDIAQAILEPAGMLPARTEGAFYSLVDLRRCGLPSRELAIALLNEEHVACAPGDTFGEVAADGWIRISLASSDQDVEEGCRRILRFAERHAATRSGG